MKPKEVKDWMNRRVIYRPSGAAYRLTAYIYRQDRNGQPVYQAELQDLTAESSVLICRLQDVDPEK